MWRVPFELTSLECALLASWPVRRLAFVAHAGASSAVTNQTYSRLEHSLGLLALVCHFAPQDQVARAAALLHDIGHLPLSHTFEGIRSLDHHQLGEQRVFELRDILRAGGIDVDQVLEVAFGSRPSILNPGAGQMRLDHFESFLRSGRTHGRTSEAPAITLSKVRLEHGAIDTGPETGAYLADLVLAEAQSQSSELNVVATTVVRDLARQLLDGADEVRVQEVAHMTDNEFWATLLDDKRTRADARLFLRTPWVWEAEPVLRFNDTRTSSAAIPHQIPRFYTDLPMISGAMFDLPYNLRTAFEDLPRRFMVSRRFFREGNDWCP
jgi:hypothetical protein